MRILSGEGECRPPQAPKTPPHGSAHGAEGSSCLLGRGRKEGGQELILGGGGVKDHAWAKAPIEPHLYHRNSKIKFLRILRQRLQSIAHQTSRASCDCTGCTPVKLALKTDNIIIWILQVRRLQLSEGLIFGGMFVQHLIIQPYYAYYRQLGLF